MVQVVLFFRYRRCLMTISKWHSNNIKHQSHKKGVATCTITGLVEGKSGIVLESHPYRRGIYWRTPMSRSKHTHYRRNGSVRIGYSRNGRNQQFVLLVQRALDRFGIPSIITCCQWASFNPLNQTTNGRKDIYGRNGSAIFGVLTHSLTPGEPMGILPLCHIPWNPAKPNMLCQLRTNINRL